MNGCSGTPPHPTPSAGSAPLLSVVSGVSNYSMTARAGVFVQKARLYFKGVMGYFKESLNYLRRPPQRLCFFFFLVVVAGLHPSLMVLIGSRKPPSPAVGEWWLGDQRGTPPPPSPTPH